MAQKDCLGEPQVGEPQDGAGELRGEVVAGQEQTFVAEQIVVAVFVAVVLLALAEPGFAEIVVVSVGAVEVQIVVAAEEQISVVVGQLFEVVVGQIFEVVGVFVAEQKTVEACQLVEWGLMLQFHQ